MSQYCILIHYHELGLKRDNKSWFEKIFQTNIKKQIKDLPYKNINTYASRVFIYGIDKNKWDDYKNKLKNVMGLKNALLMQKVDADINNITAIAYDIASNIKFDTFRITTKRQDKGFSLTSHEINQIVGAEIYEKTHKAVSLKNPQLNIPYTHDQKLVRGLDYYTKTVIELISSDLGAQAALCGGGRYDNLVEELGGNNIPAIGFAAGMER